VTTLSALYDHPFLLWVVVGNHLLLWRIWLTGDRSNWRKPSAFGWLKILNDTGFDQIGHYLAGSFIAQACGRCYLRVTDSEPTTTAAAMEPAKHQYRSMTRSGERYTNFAVQFSPLFPTSMALALWAIHHHPQTLILTMH
jgi:hypothetical protein